MRRVESDRRSCLPLGRFSAERRCISVFPPGVEPGLSPPMAPRQPLSFARACLHAQGGTYRDGTQMLGGKGTMGGMGGNGRILQPDRWSWLTACPRPVSPPLTANGTGGARRVHGYGPFDQQAAPPGCLTKVVCSHPSDRLHPWTC